MWCIPPESSAEFVCGMEGVLEVYARPYDARNPKVCMDETSKQLVAETRLPLRRRPGKAERYDYEYERRGTANVFLFTEPLASWREVTVTERRTRVDWAQRVKELLDGRYRDAERVTLIMDNLNTHGPASLYEAFEPAEARRLVERLEVVHTPKHGSWLNIAEIEMSALARQCLNRRIANGETLSSECAAWEAARNGKQTGVDWHFTTADARTKLMRLYPRIQA
jgi:hypothetical protein